MPTSNRSVFRPWRVSASVTISNRRVRTRTHGGVAGDSGQPLPLCRSIGILGKWESCPSPFIKLIGICRSKTLVKRSCSLSVNGRTFTHQVAGHGLSLGREVEKGKSPAKSIRRCVHRRSMASSSDIVPSVPTTSGVVSWRKVALCCRRCQEIVLSAVDLTGLD